MSRKILYIIIFLSFIISIVIFIYRKNETKITSTKAITTVAKEEKPFTELTIPYLRKRIYKSNIGELKLSNKNSTYNTYLTNYISDELNINALITIPSAKAPSDGWPAIVFVHGYIPPTLYKTQEKYTDYINYFSKNGFVVLKIDLRGHGKSEGIPSGVYYSSDYVVDTLNAYQALKNTNFIDPEKIVLWGHSMAGNITLRAFVSNPKIKAVAIWAGAGFTYQDLQQYRINDQSYRPPTSGTIQQNRRAELFAAYGQFNPQNEFWKSVVPTNYLSEVQGSIGLFHATNDSVVSVEYSRNLNKILNSTDIKHTLHEYPSGGHNISNPSFSKAMKDTVDFYNQALD